MMTVCANKKNGSSFFKEAFSRVELVIGEWGMWYVVTKKNLQF